MSSRFFAVQLLIEDTDPQGGYDSAEYFLQDLESAVFEEFPEYKKISVKTKEVYQEELLGKLEI